MELEAVCLLCLEVHKIRIFEFPGVESKTEEEKGFACM